MKPMRLFLNLTLILLLTACAAPDAPLQTSTPPSTAIRKTQTPTLTVTPDATLGIVKGTLTWQPSASESLPVPDVILQLDRHTGDYLKYKSRTDAQGQFVFTNVEAGEYGVGLYMNLQLGERKCDNPEYTYSRDLKWVHYSTWNKVDVWYDVIFSSEDITITSNETVVLDFKLKCP